MQQILFRTLCLFFGLVLLTQTNAQVAISPDGTSPDSSAMLDIQSTSKGLLIPRMTTMQRNSIADPATGLLVFNSDSAAFYFYTGSTWESLDSGIDDDWTIDGNTVTNSNRRQILVDSSRISFINTQNNIFLGDSAGYNNPLNSPSSIHNIGIGASSLHQNTAGNGNIALGYQALESNLSGSNNIAIGLHADVLDTGLVAATAIGYHALVGCDDCIVLGDTAATRVGIGTATPDTTLHVVGGLKYQDGNSVNGYVLTTDAEGNARWDILGSAGILDELPAPNFDCSKVAGSVSLASLPRRVAISGNYACVTRYAGSGVSVIDISNPADPFVTGTINSLISPIGLAASGHYAYVTQGDGHLNIIDISDPFAPVITGSVSTGGSSAYDVALSGDYAYVVNRNSFTMKVINISNPAAPAMTGTVDTDFSPTAVAVSGDYAYVVNSYSNTMQVIDISNPTAPAVIATVNTDTEPNDIAVSDNYAYVVNLGSNTMQVIDISNPAAPAIITTFNTGTDPRGIVVSGNYAFVANTGSNTMEVIDISNPADPMGIQPVGTGNQPYDVALAGKYACVVNSSGNTMQVIDLICPTAVTVDPFDGTLGTTDIATFGTTDYLAKFDASNTTLTLSGVIDMNGHIGIGTATPDTTLHVAGKFKYQDGTQADGYVLTSDADGNASWASSSSISNALFKRLGGVVMSGDSVDMMNDDFVFGSPSLNYSGNADHRSRFFFDKSKYAFRAGSATSGYWDSDQLGTYSVAFGDRNIASGSYSSAFGYDNQATGTSSTTFGEGNVASGSGSFIIGKDNESSGARGVAIGNSNVASGTGSVAVGRFAEGTASYSMALGYEVTASGYNSFAVGNYNTAYSAYEAVFGSYCTDYTPANANAFNNADRVFAVGNGTGNSNRSNALTILKNGNVGLGTDSPEATLHVDGTLRLEDGTQADGYVLTSDADGNANWQANTDNDTQDLSFSGTTLSLTDGGSVDLIGLSDNLGDHTATQTINTDNNWLSGDGGNEGIQIADNGGVTTSGTLSVGGIINTNTNWISGDGGSEGLQITDDGTVKFSSRINTNNQWITGDDNADEGIQIEDVGRVNVRAYVLGQDQFAMKIENTANTNSSRNDGLGIIAGHASYNSGQQSSFVQFTSPDGDYCGRVRQSGNNAVEYVSASDERLKENIRPTKYGLNDLMKIKVVDYNYRTDKADDVQTGYLAQQLYTVFPHPVDVGGEDPKTQPWGVDYGAVSPLLVSATQELAKRTEQLEKENAWLKAENAYLKGNYAALSSDVEMLKAILNTDTQVSK